MPDKMINVTAPNMAIHPEKEDDWCDILKWGKLTGTWLHTKAQEVWNDTRQEEQDYHHTHNHKGLHKQDLVCDAILLF